MVNFVFILSLGNIYCKNKGCNIATFKFGVSDYTQISPTIWSGLENLIGVKLYVVKPKDLSGGRGNPILSMMYVAKLGVVTGVI